MGSAGIASAWWTAAKRRAALSALVLALASCAHKPVFDGTRLRGALDLPAVGPVAYQPWQLRDRVVVIDFFATWCFPCVADMPNLEALQKRFAPKGVQVVAVGMDLEGQTVLEPFAENYQFPFPILVASDAIRSGESPFGRIQMLPTTIILRRDGEVQAAYAGALDHQRLETLVEQAIGD